MKAAKRLREVNTVDCGLDLRLLKTLDDYLRCKMNKILPKKGAKSEK